MFLHTICTLACLMTSSCYTVVDDTDRRLAQARRCGLWSQVHDVTRLLQLVSGDLPCLGGVVGSSVGVVDTSTGTPGDARTKTMIGISVKLNVYVQGSVASHDTMADVNHSEGKYWKIRRSFSEELQLCRILLRTLCCRLENTFLDVCWWQIGLLVEDRLVGRGATNFCSHDQQGGRSWVFHLLRL